MASFSSMPLEITSIIVREHFEELADVAVAKHGGLTKGQHVYEARKAIGSLAFSSRGMLDVCTQELNRLADTYDDLMETAYGADQEVASRKYVYLVQMLLWLECATKTIFAEDGEPHFCSCEACVSADIEVDLTTDQSYTAVGGGPLETYHLTRWHKLVIVRDLEDADDWEEQMREDKKEEKAMVVSNKRRNSV